VAHSEFTGAGVPVVYKRCAGSEPCLPRCGNTGGAAWAPPRLLTPVAAAPVAVTVTVTPTVTGAVTVTVTVTLPVTVARAVHLASCPLPALEWEEGAGIVTGLRGSCDL